mmetsp:Transcript_19318/g.30686  ORF Transcript_19318/g.30686 Transcript_19318/m.30686 type:complete len:290 (-) Transcript_19318:154-1023(-)
MSVVSSKLNLVDLAGSERFQNQSAARQKESASINLSLNTLGNVISALTSIRKDGKKPFVPYRESALTKLLCDSLGGNAHTLMIANVNPCDRNVNETISTLQYATRAKKIKNNARKNMNPKDALILKLRDEIEMLKKMVAERDDLIARLRGRKRSGGGNNKSSRGFVASFFCCCSTENLQDSQPNLPRRGSKNAMDPRPTRQGEDSAAVAATSRTPSKAATRGFRSASPAGKNSMRSSKVAPTSEKKAKATKKVSQIRAGKKNISPKNQSTRRASRTAFVAKKTMKALEK